MPFKRKRSPFYYVKLWNLPGFGSTGYVSTRVTSKRIAQDMERLLNDVAQKALLDPSWYDLLNAVCRTHTIQLPDLLAAKNQDRLDDLRRGLQDPVLTTAIQEYTEAMTPRIGVLNGLAQLERYAPADSRLSYVRNARNVINLCRAAEEDTENTRGGRGRKRNSVRRTLLQAISHLLKYHLDENERDRVMKKVQFKGEDDTREVHLSPKDILSMLDKCIEKGYPELRLIIRTFLVTSADRGVLCAGKGFRGLLVRDLRIYVENQTGEYSGEAQLTDAKTKDRDRTVLLPADLCRDLAEHCRGKGPDETVFETGYQSVYKHFKEVAADAGLPDLRIKDLRAQLSIYGEEAGIALTVISRTYGHNDERMTRRYMQRKAIMNPSQIESIASAMFIELEKRNLPERKSA